MIELPICNIGNSIDPVWNTYVKLLGPNDELPIPDHINNLNLDLETTSERPNVASTNPHAESIDDTSGNLHRDCKICGISVLFDDERIPYYVPIRHAYLDEDDKYQYRTHDCPNCNVEKVYDWLKKILSIADVWSNQNIKYDYHVIYNELGRIKIPKLRDTLNLAKLAINYREQMEYGLTNVMRLFGIDITPYENQIKACLGGYKDYGLIPPDRCAVYAGVDVLCVQFLLRNLKFGDDMQQVMQMEDELLPELIRMEQIGLRLDEKLLYKDWVWIAEKQRRRITKIKEIMDFPTFKPEKKKSQKELFVDRLGWDIEFTEDSKAKLASGKITEEKAKYSLGKDTLMKYLHKEPHVANMWLNYVGDDKLKNSYIVPYLEKFISSEGLIHTNINQILHTGRMSMTAPSMQVLPKKAKKYVIPYDEDYVLVRFDLKQIEFRVIVHYIENKAAIHKFLTDPNADFHIWMAEMCEVSRNPAKTCNFLCGYGGGEKRLIAELSGLKEIRMGCSSDFEIAERARKVYKAYHEALPELRPTSRRAANVILSRGYVRTLMNRRRYVDPHFCYKAFNTIGQGTAADIQKWITLRLRKFFSPECLLQCLVHDEWLFSIHKRRVKELVPLIKAEIERPLEEDLGVGLCVPILSDFGISDINWRECA